jgi:hypothetical protein
MDGTNGPCEVCSPNCALSEISKSLAAPQNFDDLPQDEYGIDFDTTGHMTWPAVQ